MKVLIRQTQFNMRISYSSLEAFEHCPQKYKFSEIDKIKEPKSKEAIFGNYIHEVLEWLYSQDPRFPTLEALIDYYHQNWPNKEKFKWSDEAEEKSYFEDGLRMLKKFYEDNKDREVLVLELESRFEAVIDEKPNEPGGKHILSGVIDRIDKLPDGTFEIIDYKTGKRLPAQDLVDNNLQLSLYAIGLKEKWPKIRVEDLRLTLYYLKAGEKLETRRTEEDLEKTKQAVINLIHQIEKSDFRPRPSPICQWCGYKNICPAWRHLFEKDKDHKISQYIDEYLDLRKQQALNLKRIRELKEIINQYCEDNNLERLFGTNGYISLTNQPKVTYNLEKLKSILEPMGKWDKVLSVDAKRLEEVLREIPAEARQKVEEAKIIKAETKIITTEEEP